MIRADLRISGIVQGVGFRPFVYRLAGENRLTGYVANTAAGVRIVVDGPAAVVDRFLAGIRGETPPLAVIHDFSVSRFPLGERQPYPDFTIAASMGSGRRVGSVTPDTGVCGHCLAELFDPSDRRYLYPFINCTDCGPRFTLIERAPYDRPLTGMRDFHLCEACAAEYRNPADRRFHAQATCCPACGPRVRLVDRAGRPVPEDNPVAAAAGLLKAGRIVGIKGLGGYHLAVDGTDGEAVAELRRRKGRPDKPLAVMTADVAGAAQLVQLETGDKSLLTGAENPILVLPRRRPFIAAEEVAPGNRRLGLMLPYTPLHHLLFFYERFAALVMTSGNLSGSPIIKDNDEALKMLAGIADYFLMHNRPILAHTDDSVLRPARTGPVLYRRARGYVPRAVELPVAAGRTLALGAMIKNTICLTRGREAFVSQHIGDLDNPETRVHQGRVIAHFRRLLRIEPELLVHDLHPDCPAAWDAGIRREMPAVAVQHHHAHAAACMAEHGLSGRVLAVTLDGSGYGTDGSIWGGEVLVADYTSFERVAHLGPVAMPGGDAAVREPWRMAVSHLHAVFGREFHRLELPLLQRFADRLELLADMLERGFNSPYTSSCGRLFDAVAALLDIRYSVSYEGQAAMELEMLSAGRPAEAETGRYPFAVDDAGNGCLVLPPAPIIRGVVEDVLAGVPPAVVGRRFHNTLAGLFTEVCLRLGSRYAVDRVVLSGGVFQNACLLEHLSGGLRALGLTVYSHRRLPPGDGCLALGQAVAGRAFFENPAGNDNAPLSVP